MTSEEIELLKEASGHLQKAADIFQSFGWKWTVMDIKAMIRETEEVTNGLAQAQ